MAFEERQGSAKKRRKTINSFFLPTLPKSSVADSLVQTSLAAPPLKPSSYSEVDLSVPLGVNCLKDDPTSSSIISNNLPLLSMELTPLVTGDFTDTCKLSIADPTLVNSESSSVQDLGSSTSNENTKADTFLSETAVNDIGIFIGQTIDDIQKRELLANPWQAPSNYKFPHSTHNKNGKEVRRFLGHNHLSKYNWLVFSPSKQGLYCKYCPWFTVGNVAGGQKTVKLQKLVTKPLTTFSKLLGQKGDLEEHNNTRYHKEAVQAGKYFLKNYHSPEDNILNKVNKQHLQEIQDNRLRLKPIVESTIFLGRQNIPFRGHRDDDQLMMSESETNESICNEGNFRELLRFRVAAGDTMLEHHFKHTSSRATHISKTTQNNLIDCCGKEISSQILKNVLQAGIYSIIFDETTDLSHKSQLSLVLRYVHKGELREDFIGFVDAFQDLERVQVKDSGDLCSESKTVEDKSHQITQIKTHMTGNKELSLTGKDLGGIVVRLLKGMGLPLQQCVGIGTDGCSVMLSETRGAVAEIQKEAKNALRTPCFNHALNNSISKCSEVPAIRNSIGTMKETISFFSSSGKRNIVILRKLGGQLSGLCETRWVERHDGVVQFSVDLPKIISALDTICEWRDPATAGKAYGLSTALCDSQFIESMSSLSDILSITLPLSRLLQKPSFDLVGASEAISNIISILSSRREEAEHHFHQAWSRIEALVNDLGTEIVLPRFCGRQKNRSNYQTGDTSKESYFRLAIYVPLLDDILNDLQGRFPPATLDVFHLSFLTPSAINSQVKTEFHDGNINAITKLFLPFMEVDKDAAPILLKGEFFLWKRKWSVVSESTEVPQSVMKALNSCDKDVYPLIHKLLHILATLPISNASSERSFSALRRLKTWLRSRMSEDRLIGLALLHVHRDIPVNVDSVIDRFAKTGNRRIPFLI
ncbi:52 kDa repressor of the inhibitor of the protein kinase-like [Bacillus rossius redtenbacheri]|uniref:52 kDa repressor of the inhibitor of the protein kinase-like n=1 Tax=Bacillus rossius redtenbacheri TaxID=93214 RepID=UPI002FDD95E2